jgi:ribonuclease D
VNVASVNELAEPLPSHVELVTTSEAAAALCERLAAQEVVAIDTEFMREDTYFPLLALIQIGMGSGGQIYLVDPVALPQREVLGDVVRALPMSVLHSPGEDYGVLLHATGALPKHTLDTQIAAAFAGLAPGLGLRELLRQVLEIALDKDQTRSNWLKRPLSSQQLSYAADDVRYLLPLQERLQLLIAERGFNAWCMDECRRMREQGADASLDAQPHWNFRRADELPEAAQRRLYHLLHWREQKARSSDKPRNWIAPPLLLLALAERGPGDVGTVESLLESLRIAGGKRRASALLEVLQTIDPELDSRFLAAPAAFAGALKRRYSALREAAEKRALELNLPIDLLAPRRVLEPWLREGAIPVAWRGWREEALAGVLDTVTG